MSYVDVGGQSTWIVDEGAGDTVFVLHGAFHGSDAVLRPLGSLGVDRRVVAFDRRGHGRTPDTDEDFHYDAMTAEAIAVIDAIGAGPAHVVGYSAGAVVAMYLALRRPELVRSLVLIGSNIRPARETQTLDPDAPTTAAMRASYAALSPDGSEHFDEVARKTLELQSREPTFSTEELRAITPPSLIIVADRDSTTMDETLTLFHSLPSSQLAVVPGAGHTVLWEKPDIVVQLIEDFLGSLK